MIQHPGERELRDRLAVAVGEFNQAIADFHFLPEMLALEQGR